MFVDDQRHRDALLGVIGLVKRCMCLEDIRIMNVVECLPEDGSSGKGVLMLFCVTIQVLRL